MPPNLVPINAHGATHCRTHLILELWCYADFTGLIPAWKPDSFRLADDPPGIVLLAGNWSRSNGCLALSRFGSGGRRRRFRRFPFGTCSLD